VKRRQPAVAVACLLLLVAAGCGVRSQSDAQRVSAHDVPFGLAESAPATSEAPQPHVVTIFLVRGSRLTPVTRSAAAVTAFDALEALLDGVTPDEARNGYSTAVPVGTRSNHLSVRNGIATVDLAGEFLQTNVGDSALGIAQIVQTVTRFPDVSAVRFRLDGQPVGIPKGDGSITTSAVTASDYPAPGP
jgi:hypothetical protein